jgi:hypothetical protein
MSRLRSLGFWSAVLTVGLLVVLRPLASAGPVDPSWIDGYYDGGDFDDVAYLIGSTSAVADAPATLPWTLPRVPDLVAEGRIEPPHPGAPPSLFSRAPPLFAPAV